MNKSIVTMLLAGFIAAAGVFPGGCSQDPAETISIGSFEDFSEYFDRNGYSIQKWKQGTQDVPRLAILDIPDAWREKIAEEMTVPEKKRTFFRLTIPLAFIANHGVATDQAKLVELKNKHSASGGLAPDEQKWLMEQAAQYAVKSDAIDAALFEALLERMDIIPPSLVIAQMVEESGWGTSRFAAEGNALFGQWSYTEGIKPEDQRAGKGDYRIESFKTPLASIQAYMINLNSHDAYVKFRKRRAELRAKGLPVTGPELVGTLIDYSERREAYVDIIREIMESNKLPPLDHARLAEGETVFIRLDE